MNIFLFLWTPLNHSCQYNTKMKKITSLSKSPIREMFSSVFKREDIKASRNLYSSDSGFKSRSFSYSKESLLTTSSFKNNDFYSNSKHNSSNDQLFNTSFSGVLSENTETQIKSSKKAWNEKTRIQDFEKKYTRMENFYKTQIKRLAEEASHYKTLYHKILLLRSSENKSSRS